MIEQSEIVLYHGTDWESALDILYTKQDLMIRTDGKVSQAEGIISHSHTVEFGRILTEAEQHLFRSVLIGFYHTVRFSGQFGGELLAEPLVEFISPQRANYTLRQKSLSGSWKELLFAILTNFSIEVAPILLHDESKAFAPAQEFVAA